MSRPPGSRLRTSSTVIACLLISVTSRVTSLEPSQRKAPSGSPATVGFAAAGKYLTDSVRPLRVVSIRTSPGVWRITTVTGPTGVPCAAASLRAGSIAHVPEKSGRLWAPRLRKLRHMALPIDKARFMMASIFRLHVHGICQSLHCIALPEPRERIGQRLQDHARVGMSSALGED